MASKKDTSAAVSAALHYSHIPSRTKTVTHASAGLQVDKNKLSSPQAPTASRHDGGNSKYFSTKKTRVRQVELESDTEHGKVPIKKEKIEIEAASKGFIDPNLQKHSQLITCEQTESLTRHANPMQEKEGTSSDPRLTRATLHSSLSESMLNHVMRELEQWSQPTEAAKDLNEFAISVDTYVKMLMMFGKKECLHSREMAWQILSKLSPHMQYRWYDYADEYHTQGEPIIVSLSSFLTRDATRAMRFSYTPATLAVIHYHDDVP